MSTVETISGPIRTDDLGVTLMHEHVFLRDLELEANYPDRFWSEQRMVEEAVRTLSALRDASVSSIVDVTVPGLGRKIDTVATAARRVELNVIVATGFFCERDLPLHLRTHGPGRRIDVPEPLRDIFVEEITNGIAGSGLKAGVIKVSSDVNGITPDIARVFKAAVYACLHTGVPITTHSDAGTRGGLEQQAFLSQAGVDLGSVVIGHSGDSTDLDYLMRLMDAGSTIGMDRFGFSQYLSTDDRIDTIVKLCDRGYAGRMVLSHDANVYSSITPPEHRERMLREHGYEWTFLMFSERIVPELQARGVTDADIHRMLVDNPSRILGR